MNAKTMAAYEKSAKETSSKAKTDGTTPAKMMRLFALYENLVRFTMPLCSSLTDRDHPRTPITQSNNIVDISGVGLKQFWNLRGHMQDASTLATAHYPETLDRIFVGYLILILWPAFTNLHKIIGAPSFFPTVWGWIKKWFDPITTSKIFILSNHDLKQTLESFIDPKNIPKKYGGELEFVFGDQPVLDPHLASVTKWEGDNKDFPHGPMYWVKSKDGKQIEAMVVGSRDGKQRKEAVCTISINIEDNQDSTTTNGDVMHLRTNHPDLLRVPTAAPSVASIAELQTPGPVETSEESVPVVVQDGEVVPATRPEPVSFVTAAPGIETLSLNEKAGDLTERSTNEPPHTTVTANLLDPSLKYDGAGDLPTTTEDAHTHHEASDASPVVGGGVEEADKAHVAVAPTNGHVDTTTNGHEHHHGPPTKSHSVKGEKGEGKRHSGVFGKVKAKVGL